MSPKRPVYREYDREAVPGRAMTDAMTAMRVIASARNDLDEVVAALEILMLDACEITWSERQQMTHILVAQGRPFSHRAALSAKLNRRGIETGRGGYSTRPRTEQVRSEPVAPYLMDAELDEIQREAAALRLRIQRHLAVREEQYPQQHRQVRGRLAQNAAALAA